MSDWTDETAEWYADKYGEYATNRLAVDALELPDDAVIVDIGCGAGSALRHAATRVTRGQLIGVDPVARMVEIARERAADSPHRDQIEFRQGSAESVPVADGVADVVLAFDSIDHWADPAAGFAEVRRILVPSGIFAIVKDRDAPGAAEVCRDRVATLAAAGFEVLTEAEIDAEQVSFTAWSCRAVRE